MANQTLADQLEIWGLEDDFLIYTDGSLGFGLKITPKDVGSLSDDAINTVSLQLKTFLNSLPSGVSLQFIQDIKAGNKKTIDQYADFTKDTNNTIAGALCEEKINHFSQLDEDGELPFHDLTLLLRRPPSFQKKKKLFSREKVVEISDELIEKDKRHLERIKLDLVEGLKGLDFEVDEMSNKEILRDVYKQWNPGRKQEFHKFDPEDVRDDLLFTDVTVDDKGFKVADWYHSVISLKNLPDQTYASMARHLRELPFDSRVFLTINVPDQLKETSQLQTQRRVAYSMVVGQGDRVTDLESQSKFQEIEGLLGEMINDGEKVFDISLNILLRSKNELELEDQASLALASIRELAGAEGLVETLAGFEIFKQVALPNARSNERLKKIKSSNLADLLPVYAPWQGHKKPSLLLRSSAGSLFKFDPFDSSHTNANQLISAGSGAGKSVFCNLFILQMLKENPQVFFVDIGGSYQKLCENLGGQYVPLGVDCGVSINPFDLPAGDEKPSHLKVKFLVGLIELMTKEDDSNSLPRLTRSLLEESIIRVYKEHENPTMSDLRGLLLSSDSKRLKEVGQILGSWCGDTAFGQFLDRPTNIKTENGLVAFDLKGLESLGELQTVCLYLITDLIWRQIQNNRYQMKFVVFDECWRLLKDKAGQDFIESIFRTCRKYYTSCIAISQAIQDFAESEISSAIIPNCSIKWLLQQGQSDSTAITKHLGLNENEVQLVAGLRQKIGHFSESYLLSGTEGRSVVMVEPSPIELWLATTNPKDLKVIEDEKKLHPEKSQLEILKGLAKKHPHGCAS